MERRRALGAPTSTSASAAAVQATTGSTARCSASCVIFPFRARILWPSIQPTSRVERRSVSISPCTWKEPAPWRAQSPIWAARKLRVVARTWTASRRLVLPAPLPPSRRCDPRTGAQARGSRLRKSRAARWVSIVFVGAALRGRPEMRRAPTSGRPYGDRPAGASDPHRHDHAEVAGVGPVLRIADALRVLVLELQADRLGLHGGQELGEVVGVDPHPELGAVVGAGDLLDRFPEIGVDGRDHHLVGRELEADGARPVAGHQGGALYGVDQELAVEQHLFVVVLGDHPLVVGEGPFQDAADQLAPAEAEGEVVLAAAVGELALPLEALELLEGLARHQDGVLAAGALQPTPDQGQAMAVGL